MASAITNFTAVGVGNQLQLIKDDKFSYIVGGTFVGKVVLEQSTDGGASWIRVSEYSAPETSVLTVKYGGSNTGVYRFQCVEFTSGTIETTISDEDIVLFDVKNNRLEQRFVVDEAGTKVSGTFLVNGAPVGSGMETDFSNADPSVKDINFGAFRGVNAAEPSAASDLATKNYVDTNSSGANTNLSNLTSPTSINQNLLASGNRDFGDSTNPWVNGWFEEVHLGRTGSARFRLYASGSIQRGQIYPGNAVTPQGNTAGLNFYSNAGSGSNYPIGIYSSNDTFINGNGTGDIYVETGDKTQAGATGDSGLINIATGDVAGSGDSGDVVLSTGTINTGSRGKIKLDALMATLPTGTADPTGVDNGDCYYNTSTNQLRVYNGSWRGVTLA